MSDTPLFDRQNEIWERFHLELPEVVRKLQGVPEVVLGPESDLTPRPIPVPTEPVKPSPEAVLRVARKAKRSGNPAKRARAEEIERMLTTLKGPGYDR